MPDDALVEQFDQIIEALLAGGEPAVSPEVAGLTQIAAALRDLPDENFQKHLKSDLQRIANMTTSATAPIRKGFRTITPFIVVPDAPQLIEFLKQTFGAEVTPRHRVTTLRIGDSDLIVMGGESVRGNERIGAFHIFVADCDAVFKRAIEAGATSMGEPADRPYGERSGFVKDFAGNYWYISTRFASTVVPEGVGSLTPYAHPAKARPFIDFLKNAFGAQEMGVYEHDGRVMHASVRIGDAVLEMGEAPEHGMPSSFYLHVEDCDAVYRRAIEAGATSLWPPTDQPWGDRTAGLADPFGHQWLPSSRTERV